MNKKHFYYFVMVLFALEVATIALHADRLVAAPVIFWVLIGPATLRAARTISFNAIGEPFRKRWTVVEPDGSGAGDTVHPKEGSGLGELLACPICTGTHAAAGILALYGLLPAAGLALVALLGAAGVSELLHWTAEVIEWKGHAAREETGKMVRARTKQQRWQEEIAVRYERSQKEMESTLFGGDTLTSVWFPGSNEGGPK